MKQKDIVKKLRKFGYKVTVLNSFISNRSGIPDCMISFNGKPVFIEIKIDNDKLSKLQQEFQKEFYYSSFVLWYKTKTNSYFADFDEKGLLVNGKFVHTPEMIFVTQIVSDLNNAK